MKPAISVIIPTYNRAEYVVQCVESVLAQTFSDIEIIVVDDGSTDSTRERLGAFSDVPRFHYRYQPNNGRSSARNRGIGMAQGEFVVFLDSDDLLFPNALEHLHDAAARSATAGMIVGQTQFIDDGMNVVRTLEPKIDAVPAGFAYPTLIGGERYFLLQGSFLLRRSCLEQVGTFDAALEPCEDYDFCLRVAWHCEIACLEKMVLRCRVHGGNTSTTGLFVGGIRVAQKHLKLLGDSGSLPVAARRRSRAQWTLKMADNYYGLGDNANALKHYLRALVVDPAGLLRDPRVSRQVLASLVPVQLRERLKLMRSGRERLNAA